MSLPRNLGCLPREADASEETVLIDESTGRARTFTQCDLARFADCVGRSLGARGVQPGEAVALIGRNSAEYLIAYLGVMKAGCIAAPINPRLPPAVIADICRDTGIRHALLDEAAATLDLPDLTCLDLATACYAEPMLSAEITAVQTGDSDIGLILFTSGSTGRPKGVALSHRSQLAALEALAPMGRALSGKATIVAAPLFHMNALTFCHLLIFNRGRIVLMDRFEAQGYLRAIARHSVNVVSGVPTMISMMARENELAASLDLSSVSMVALGSAPISDGLVEEVRRLFPRASISNGYGTTEIGPAIFGAHPTGLKRPPASVGYPLATCEVRLADGTESEGVLEVRSPSLMEGYVGRPDLTQARMRDGFYRTGDIMRRDEDGFFYFVGREDDMFNCGGENIYPREVERILEQHPDVAEACVVPLADTMRGYVPVAFVVLRGEDSVTPEGLKAFCLANGPPHLHPRRIHILDELPLTGPNKVDRNGLRERAAAA